MELSWIAKEILENAICQMEDAKYENHARVFIGDAMVLLEKDDFDELKANILAFDPNCDEDIKNKEFEDVVNIKADEV